MYSRIKSRMQIVLAVFLLFLAASGASRAEDTVENAASAASKLENALLRPVTASFTDTPLEKVVAALSQKMGAPILIDQKSLADTEVTGATPVSAALRDVRFESALALITESLGLTWRVSHDVVIISGPRCLPVGETRFYPIAKLAHALGGSRSQERLRRLLVEQVLPWIWDEVGGESFLRLLPNVLVASMPAHGHAELTRFLAELEQACGLQPRRPIDSLSEQALEKALDAEAQFEFQKTPLDAALRQIANQYGISIVADEKVLAEAGFPIESPIMARLEGVKLGPAIQNLLSNLDLGWTIRHEALWVTSKTELENALTRKLYRVDDLITPGKPGAISSRQLLELVTETIAPSSWIEVGGPAAVDLFAPRLLIVLQTPGAHQELESQLAELRQALKVGVADDCDNRNVDRPAQEELQQEVYLVGDLSGDDLATAIRDTIAPKTWTEYGGTGTIHLIRAGSRAPVMDDAELHATPSVGAAASVLLIRQTAEVHREIAELWRQLGLTPRED